MLIGRIGNIAGSNLLDLPIYEREVLMCALYNNKPFRLTDVSTWLQLKKETCRKIVRNLQTKELVGSIGGGITRCHEFVMTEKAINFIHHRT